MLSNVRTVSFNNLRGNVVAKKAKDTLEETQETNGAPAAESPNDGGAEGETIAGYFRRIFAEKPRLLRQRSNKEVFARWLKDHPGHDKVPANVKTGLQNIKSVLKKKGKAQTQSSEPKPAQASQPALRRTSVRGLDALEFQIDECLTLAKTLDRDGLQAVIGLLRQARNQVVLRLGE